MVRAVARTTVATVHHGLVVGPPAARTSSVSCRTPGSPFIAVSALTTATATGTDGDPSVSGPCHGERSAASAARRMSSRSPIASPYQA
jgi:hypothetical protein